MQTCVVDDGCEYGLAVLCGYESKNFTATYRILPQMVASEEDGVHHIELQVAHSEYRDGTRISSGVAGPVLTVEAARKLAARLLELADKAEAIQV
jgi:hypothetical protein